MSSKKKAKNAPKLPKLKIGQLHKCPKCNELYKPKYDSKETSKLDHDKQYREQFMSGICSTDCWHRCSQEEITQFKYISPLQKSANKVFAYNKKGELVQIA